MKKTLFSGMLLCVALAAGAHDYFFLPDTFFPKAGDTLVFHLYVGDDFTKELEERPMMRYIVASFDWCSSMIFHSKKINSEDYICTSLLEQAGDTVLPAATFDRGASDGLSLLSMNRRYAHIAFTPEKFAAYLKAEHLDAVLAAFNSRPRQDSVHEKYTRYIKSLVAQGTPSGTLYRRRIGQQLEIVLLTNPYAIKKGGNITAQLFFRDKPLAGGSVEVLCRQADGTVSILPFKTDKGGKVHFKVDKSGAWMVRITHMLPSQDKDADWESFWASYTFGVK